MTRPAATDLITTLSLSLVLESHFVVLFPFAFHIAVQQPFKQLLSRQLLCEHEPYRASFALCFKSLTMSLLSAPEEFVSEFVSPRHLSSSDSYPFDLSGLGDPTGSSATAGLAVGVTGTSKPRHHWLLPQYSICQLLFGTGASENFQNFSTTHFAGSVLTETLHSPCT